MRTKRVYLFRIMISGWATRAVSLPSMILRTAIDLQTGIAAAMLAALALESGSVLLHDTAKVSSARAQRARPHTLIHPLTMGLLRNLRDYKKLLTVAAVVLLAGSALILQFSSTILLSDLRLGSLPGKSGLIINRPSLILPWWINHLMYAFSACTEGLNTVVGH